MTIERVAAVRVFPDGTTRSVAREIPVETPVAIVHDGSTHAVMMATPSDIEDFAVGFSVSEGVIDGPADISGLDIVEQSVGIEARLWLAPAAARSVVEHRRRIVGPTGCGLCGVDSLELAARPIRRVAASGTFHATTMFEAARALATAQSGGRTTRAMHAAALYDPDTGLVAIREDVGRHNALDKLLGHVLRAGIPTAGRCCVITSRVSVEMVQKAAVLGTPVLLAVSAPTSLALAAAREAGITLCAVARDDAFEVFAGAGRIAGAGD
jgi:FdhD protein